VRKPDAVFLLYEELLPFFKDCYGDINERVQDDTGYFIYNVITENMDEFYKVIRLFKRGEKMEAFKLMEEIIDSFLKEWRERYFKS